MSRAASLMRLQKIDSEIDLGRARLAEVQAALAQDQGLAEARRALAAAQDALARARGAVRALEGEVQAVAGKAAETEAALYGGRVTNPKELQDLQEELASLRRRRAALEDRQLEAMLQAESDEAAEQEAQARAAQVEAALQQAQIELAAEQARLAAELERLGIEREAAEAPLSPGDRQTYEGLRRRKRGVAVARLEDGACAACGVAPSSARAQAAGHADELIFCGNCERILYSG